jgi:GNAT superfamily N-acetyltransferase
MILRFSVPQPLTQAHLLDEFQCGEPVLDEWLRRRALANQLSRSSRTFVVTDPNGRVVGYYALAAGSVARQSAVGAVRRNAPDPVPVIVLGRLAVDRRARGVKLGGALLQDAVTRTLAVAENAGVRALLAHALHERARQFYEYYGFQASPVDALTMMLPLAFQQASAATSKAPAG